MNKFEQVSSDHRQEGEVTSSDIEGVPYHLTYPMMHLMLPTPLNRMTDTCENITFQQLHLRAVII